MPPRIKISRDEIINTALNIVRESGEQALNARNIASALSCSTQPIFSNFENMDELRLAVVEKADNIFEEYSSKIEAEGEFPDYKANGMAYIKFAREEKELFKLLYMRNRSGEPPVIHSRINDKMENLVHKNTGLKGNDIKLFHFEMWAFVHGIATMFATNYLDLDMTLVSKMVTDTYRGLRKQYGMED
ncbi:MAG: TetR/AcrR family transcriptional regulator [Clostridia bacterium]|nr:TetR/AcrR family transcriptional regulator [Clostridia bacterium]